MAKDNSDVMPKGKGSDTDSRRSFFKFLGIGASAAVVAPNVKAAVEVPKTAEGAAVLERFNAARESSYEGFLSYCMDVQDGVIYDRIRFKAGMTVPRLLNFFQTPMGQQCPYTGEMKTLLHTSMHGYGMLNAPNQMLVQRVLFAVHPSADPYDLEQLSANYLWELRLMQKTMHRAPVLLNPPALSKLSGIVNTEAPSKGWGSSVPTADPIPPNVLASAHQNRITGGLMIPALAFFVVQFDNPLGSCPTLRSDLDLLVGLQGAEARGVQ